MLSVSGLCAQCETPTTMTCRLCGRPVCFDHVVEDEMVCGDCGNGRVVMDD